MLCKPLAICRCQPQNNHSKVEMCCIVHENYFLNVPKRVQTRELRAALKGSKQLLQKCKLEPERACNSFCCRRICVDPCGIHRRGVLQRKSTCLLYSKCGLEYFFHNFVSVGLIFMESKIICCQWFVFATLHCKCVTSSVGIILPQG